MHHLCSRWRNLGWINAKALSGDIATQLKNMKKGQVTEPIYKITLFYLLNFWIKNKQV